MSVITATASIKSATVSVCLNSDGTFGGVYKYEPKSVGAWENKPQFDALVIIAAAKLGFKRDKRCKNGWRKFV